MKYTDEMHTFILANNRGIKSQELAERFNKQFGTNVKASQMAAYRKNHKIPSGYDARFVKGQESYNKGKKMTPEQYERSKGTMFKKGEMPHNHKPIGSESLRWQSREKKNRIIWVKVAEPKTWKEKHVLTWEEHNGPVPEDHVIIFLDGNTLNTDISNLACISKRVNLIINKHELRFKNKELTETGILVGKIISSIEKR